MDKMRSLAGKQHAKSARINKRALAYCASGICEAAELQMHINEGELVIERQRLMVADVDVYMYLT